MGGRRQEESEDKHVGRIVSTKITPRWPVRAIRHRGVCACRFVTVFVPFRSTTTFRSIGRGGAALSREERVLFCLVLLATVRSPIHLFSCSSTVDSIRFDSIRSTVINLLLFFGGSVRRGSVEFRAVFAVGIEGFKAFLRWGGEREREKGGYCGPFTNGGYWVPLSANPQGGGRGVRRAWASHESSRVGSPFFIFV